MTDYVVAIPTYKRYDEVTKKTLPTLKKGGVPKNKIHVFVANKTEEKLYKEKMDPDTYGHIVVGKKGLVNQRIFISEYFPMGTCVVSLDDDVQNFLVLHAHQRQHIVHSEILLSNLREGHFENGVLLGLFLVDQLRNQVLVL